MQTAMQKLISQIKEEMTIDTIPKEWYYCLKSVIMSIEATYLEMERQQIIDAYNNGDLRSADLYYDETYGSKGSDEKKEYPHSHIYETMNGRYGLSSYNEHDQTDGIFDTYQEAVDFGLSLIKKSTSSLTEISDEEIDKASKYWNETTNPEMWTYKLAWKAGAKWYREQLKKKQ